MKKHYSLAILFIFVCFFAKAQITNEGEPLSWSQVTLKSSSSVRMEPVDMVEIQKEDEINDQDRSKPWRFGYEFNVDLGMDNSGTWDELPNGDRIWRINIISSGAKTMNFVFDKYQVPEGASVYLYSNDRTDLLGAYTHIMKNEDEKLGTWIVESDNVWIEYYEPKEAIGQGFLNIGKVVHGYRLKALANNASRNPNTSGDCNHDVDCTVGSDFDPLKDRLKHSVAFIIMQGSLCTGQLINNTNNDQTPYFLTANHCDAGATSTWAFRFNWISPTPICGSTTDSPAGPTTQTTSGATNLANNTNSDVRLLQLTGGLNSSWDLEWAGWDRSNSVPDFTVAIHHPSGDIMKVARDNDSPFQASTSFNGDPTTSVWVISGAGGGGGNGWDIGVTEQGSSGGALFDNNGRIVGQLAGGNAACSGTNDNGGFDIYGRFATSWNDNNFGQWLDPANTGLSTWNMYSQVLSTPAEDFSSQLEIFPNPTDGLLNINNRTNEDINYIVYSVLGKTLKTGSLSDFENEINLSSLSEGIYIVRLNQGNSSLHRKVIVSK